MTRQAAHSAGDVSGLRVSIDLDLDLGLDLCLGGIPTRAKGIKSYLMFMSVTGRAKEILRRT